MNCENCNGSCGDCGSELFLTEAELALLRRFGETPFLPAAAAYDMKTPVYLEDEGDWGPAILGLAGKGLIQLDYDIPLKNFDYMARYQAWPLHGSMALTGRGQDILEQIEIQGIEE